MSEPKLRAIPEQTVIAIEHIGSYDEIGKVYQELSEWAKDNGVRVVGKGLTIFHSPPNEFDARTARFEVCLQIEGSVKSAGRVKVKLLPAAKVFCYRHTGPYAQIPARYTECLAWISAQGLEIVGPPREIYIRRPKGAVATDTEAAKLVTEIQFPVNA